MGSVQEGQACWCGALLVGRWTVPSGGPLGKGGEDDQCSASRCLLSGGQTKRRGPMQRSWNNKMPLRPDAPTPPYQGCCSATKKRVALPEEQIPGKGRVGAAGPTICRGMGDRVVTTCLKWGHDSATFESGLKWHTERALSWGPSEKN